MAELRDLVDDLGATLAEMRARGLRLRNGVATGPGGKRARVMDPSSNLVEVFEPA